MATRSTNLNINISAETRQLERGIDRAQQAMQRYQRSVEDAGNAIARLERELADEQQRAADRRAAAWEQSGTVIAAASAAMAAGLGLAGRAAMQWESDWTGVARVLDATPEQMGVLEQQIRDLGSVLPATHTEIAATAAAAAQLGVANEHLVAFTSSAVALGVATDLASDEAAMGLARLSTVMGVSFGDINQMGASMVELGNQFAATESEILAMSLRLSGAGNQIGLTSGEVMGLATAFSSVGINAELGGGAFSRSLGRMQAAVLEGGSRLEGFARVAQMSAEEFSIAFQTDPQQAIVAFLRGLDQVNQSGGSVYTTLADLGLTGTEIADVMTRASAAWQTVAQAVDVGNQAFDEGNALIEEAAMRYQTTEAQVQIAQNSFTNLGIAIGENLLPMLGAAAEHATAWTNALADSEDPVLAVAGGAAGVASAVGLVTGAFVLGAPRVAEYRNSLNDLGPRAQRFGDLLSSAAGVMTGPWGAAIGAGILALGIWADRKAMAEQRTRDFTNAIRQDSGELGANSDQLVANIIAKEDLIEKAEEFGLSTDTLVGAMFGEAAALREVEAALNDQNMAYTRTADGGSAALNQRAASARVLREEIDLTRESVQTAVEDYEQERDVLASVERQGYLTGESTAALGESQALLGEQVTDTTDRIRELHDALNALTRVHVDAIAAESAWEEAIDSASEAIEANGTTLDLNTEAGRSNERSLRTLRDRSLDYATATYEQTGSLEDAIAVHRDGRAELARMAQRMGLTEDAADDLADAYLGTEGDFEATLEVDARGHYRVTNAQAPGGAQLYASGGAVSGPGTATSDSVPAMLSAGEHVLTAREVQMLGGQDAVYAMRSLIRDGDLRFAQGGAVQRFADGGEVLPRSARIINDHREDVRVKIQQMYRMLIDGIAVEAGKMAREYFSAGPVVAAWRSQLGVPYSWGGGGPNGPSKGILQGRNTVGFDCSSLMQYGWSKVGVNLPRTTFVQILSGRGVPRGQERPGDLVFPHLGHVAGVAEPGRLIHAPQTGSVVSYRPMYAAPLAIRRPGRYDRGGIWGINSSGRDERVLSPRQTVAFERLVDGVLSSHAQPVRGGDGAAAMGDTHYHIHSVPGYSTLQDLQRADEHRQRLARVGRPK